jgi:hypothetical protein
MNTVRVRIPVVVDAVGNWNVVLFPHRAALAGPPHQISWITAEVPIPKTPLAVEVAGEVEADKAAEVAP